MLAALRRNLTTILVSFVTAAVTAGGPALADAVREGLNADQVDSKDAVGFGATTNQRKGNLVATNRETGRLPNDIIAKAPDANRLDGLNSTKFARTVLQPGEVLTGEYGMRGAEAAQDTINFRIPLPAPVSATFIGRDAAFTTECPGLGQAKPGNLCVYERYETNRGYISIYHQRGADSGGAAGASRDGFQIYMSESDGIFQPLSIGEWAVSP